MNVFQKSSNEILQELKVNPSMGLDSKEIVNRQEKYGKNQFSPGTTTPLYKKIFSALKEPMIFILLVAAFITLSMNLYRAYHNMNAEFTESIGILVAIFLSTGIEIIMEGKSQKAFDALNNINEDIQVKVLRNGVIQYINKNHIVVGDIVKVETGDKIPADGRLLKVQELKVDESMLTGESIAVSKNTRIINEPKVSLSNRTNMLFAGTFVTYGQGLMVVTSVGDKTEMGNIASELKNNLAKSTPLQEKLHKLAKTITSIGITCAVIIFLYEIFKMYKLNNLCFDSIQQAFITSVALIVASVPEGLPTVVAITLSLNIIKIAKTNALVRKLVACETIGCINVICSDKTGTLTKNEMTVIDIWNNGSLIKPYELKNSYMFENFILNSTANINVENNITKFVGNSTECALLKAFNETICAKAHNTCNCLLSSNTICNKKCTHSKFQNKNIIDYIDIRNSSNIVHQYPFSSDKKSMTTIINEDDKLIVYTKGSPEKILSLCDKIIINNEIIDFTEDIKNKITNNIETFQAEAKRILAFSHKEISSYEKFNDNSLEQLECHMIFDGFVSIADPLRDDIYESISKCKNSGIDIKILTGDNIITATSIAKQLDIIKDDSIIIEANAIDKLSDEELINILDKIVVIARSKPLTKMRIVKLLKENGSVVAVTGDGINDAPALKNADVGIAMGITGTEVSKEASDIVLLDDSFSTIVKSVEWGRGIYENFQRFIQFQLTVNLVAILIVFVCEILGFDCPFTTIQLLWVNLIMDGPPALSLGLESLRDYLMDRRPVERNANIITHNMLSNIVLNGLFIVIILILIIKNHILGGTLEEQSSIIFTVFVLFQLFNAFNSRELGCESIFKNFFKNKPMIYIMSITFILQVFITQFGGKLFKTSPLSFSLWLKIILLSFSVVVFSEVIKFLKRHIIKYSTN